MINYCFDYYKVDGTYVDGGTSIFDTSEERADAADKMLSEGYNITGVYENEDCYCQARYEGECACGNFK